MFLKPLRVLFGLLGTLLGASWGDLGQSWDEIGLSWGDFWDTSIIDDVFELFLQEKGCPKGCIWEAKTEQKSMKKKRRKFERKSHLLESSWCDFGSISKASWGQTC